MVVYGKYMTRYSLGLRAIKSSADGSVYEITGSPTRMAKIYNKSIRTPAKEQQIMDAINGTGSMVGETPIEPVYNAGNFVGYVFEKEPDIPVPVSPVPTGQKSGTGFGVNNPVIIFLISAAVGVIFSSLLVNKVFPSLSLKMTANVAAVHFHGYLMVIMGWIALIFAFVKVRTLGVGAVVINAVAFVAGALVVYFLIYGLSLLFGIFLNVFTGLLPIIIILAVIAMLLKRK